MPQKAVDIYRAFPIAGLSVRSFHPRPFGYSFVSATVTNALTIVPPPQL